MDVNFFMLVAGFIFGVASNEIWDMIFRRCKWRKGCFHLKDAYSAGRNDGYDKAEEYFRNLK